MSSPAVAIDGGSSQGCSKDNPASNQTTSAYFNIDWIIRGVDGSPRSIKTRIDTQSRFSLIQYQLVKALGLRIRPILPGRHPASDTEIELTGFGGGNERVVEWTEIDIECRAIGQGRVKGAVYIVHARQVDGLLLGTKFIDEHRLIRKIVDAEDRENNSPHDARVEPVTIPSVNTIMVILDGRPKATKKRETQTDDREMEETRGAVIDSILRLKGIRASDTPRTSIAAGVPSPSSSPSASRTSSWGSNYSETSVFSDTNSIPLSVATSVSSSGSSNQEKE